MNKKPVREFNIQLTHSKVCPVIVLHCRGEELLYKDYYSKWENLTWAIEQFKKECPKGMVRVETQTGEVRKFKESDLVWLFDIESKK